MLLVVLVIVLFLQTWRAAVIPLLAIPISLIGTFFTMTLFGFSLNNLSLFGLVLAIGIVVDDAIVVVENVERNIAAGQSPREAARRTMDEVGTALISIALVLCAVFVPTTFITGISGQFYRQFALTITSATIISLIVSLTLSPAMCALLLKAARRRSRRRLVRQADAHVSSAASTAASMRWPTATTPSPSAIVRFAVVMLLVYVAILGFRPQRIPLDAAGLHSADRPRHPDRGGAVAAGLVVAAHRRRHAQGDRAGAVDARRGACGAGPPRAGRRTVTLFGATDNLVKGGAGQAIENMNLLLGLDEKASLADPGPWPP